MSIDSQIILIYFIIGILYAIYRWNKDIRCVIIWRYYCLTICIIFWPIVMINQSYEYIKRMSRPKTKE